MIHVINILNNMILGILHRYFVTVTKRTKNGPLSATMLITKGALASEMVR